MSSNRIIYFNFDNFIALVFALVPFTQLYKIPGVGTNVAFTSVLIFGALYIIYSFSSKRSIGSMDSSCAITLPVWLLMFVYCVLHLMFFPPKEIFNKLSGSYTSIASQFIFLLVCIIVFTNKEARKHYVKYIEIIAMAMTFVVAFQQLFYFFTGSSITTDRAFLLPFKDYFIDSVKYSVNGSLMVINGLFRPSAFFLEPAHYSQFCLIGLATALANSTKLFDKKAIIISIGIVLTTSGVGVVSTIVMWALRFTVDGKKFSDKTLARIAVGSLLLIVVFLGLIALSDSFKMAIMRLFVSSGGHRSAFEGRLGSRSFLNELDPLELLIGMGYKNIPTYGPNNVAYYMTGIIELIYCQGLFGTFIFLTMYVYMMLKSFKNKALVPLYALIVYIPYLLGSANLVILSLAQYIPLLYLERNDRSQNMLFKFYI